LRYGETAKQLRQIVDQLEILMLVAATPYTPN
jgi:hypothetical protein